MKQTTDRVFMIRPVAFAFNAQTAVSNAFQKNVTTETTQAKALAEFNTMVAGLQSAGVSVDVFEDTIEPHTPDSIFPNNWISTHADGTIVVYPMHTPNRRAERRPDILKDLSDRFVVKTISDISAIENESKILEGTGSLVLDREHKIAYAGLSPRTTKAALEEWSKHIPGYQLITFNALDQSGGQIYHTNVMMCVAEQFVVICLDAVADTLEKQMLVNSFQKTNKTIIDISYTQMNAFAGNMLALRSIDGSSLLVMSTSAYNALSENQVAVLKAYTKILHFNLSTIETNGGGSARCMIAENHLQKK